MDIERFQADGKSQRSLSHCLSEQLYQPDGSSQADVALAPGTRTTGTRRAIGLEHSGSGKVVCGETRTRLLRDLLAELQDEARDVFANSGETVDRFLCERREEAQREFGRPA